MVTAELCFIGFLFILPTYIYFGKNKEINRKETDKCGSPIWILFTALYFHIWRLLYYHFVFLLVDDTQIIMLVLFSTC